MAPKPKTWNAAAALLAWTPPDREPKAPMEVEHLEAPMWECADSVNSMPIIDTTWRARFIPKASQTQPMSTLESVQDPDSVPDVELVASPDSVQNLASPMDVATSTTDKCLAHVLDTYSQLVQEMTESQIEEIKASPEYRLCATIDRFRGAVHRPDQAAPLGCQAWTGAWALAPGQPLPPVFSALMDTLFDDDDMDLGAEVMGSVTQARDGTTMVHVALSA